MMISYFRMRPDFLRDCFCVRDLPVCALRLPGIFQYPPRLLFREAAAGYHIAVTAFSNCFQSCSSALGCVFYVDTRCVYHIYFFAKLLLSFLYSLYYNRCNSKGCHNRVDSIGHKSFKHRSNCCGFYQKPHPRNRCGTLRKPYCNCTLQGIRADARSSSYRFRYREVPKGLGDSSQKLNNTYSRVIKMHPVFSCLF